jgi:hypothetical protein
MDVSLIRHSLGAEGKRSTVPDTFSHPDARAEDRGLTPTLAETWSDLMPRSSGKEDRYNRENFRRNPAGNQSRPAEPGQQPEASFAR